MIINNIQHLWVPKCVLVYRKFSIHFASFANEEIATFMT